MQVAQHFNAAFYVLEHRYYGHSQPKPDWTTKNLELLNVNQALADLNNFIIETNKTINQEKGEKNRKWITIGGSYPGALSAWFKHEYPETAFAAWSSSGVINPAMNYNGTDQDIYEATLRSGPQCVEVI